MLETKKCYDDDFSDDNIFNIIYLNTSIYEHIIQFAISNQQQQQSKTKYGKMALILFIMIKRYIERLHVWYLLIAVLNSAWCKSIYKI